MSVFGERFLLQHAATMGLIGEKINPASIDLKIGNKVTLVHFGGYKPKKVVQAPDYDPYQQILVDAQDFEPIYRHTEVDLKDFPEGIYIRPGVGCLLTTQSEIRMPVDMVGQVLLKSSRGRDFYQSCLAGFIDNGFNGELTLEIYAPVVPILLKDGMEIVQVRFDGMEGVGRSYTGKYQGQIGPTAARDD